MKKILITGKNSYIGTSLEKWLAKEPENYQVDTVDTRDGIWKEKDFSPYDVVFHVAGIAHIKETNKNENLYYKINRDLAVSVAKKAKKENVSQFILMSTMAVYGEEGEIGIKVTLSRDTLTKPKTHYGASKIEAEHEINNLNTSDFRVVTLRPPMIYGPNCPGNYARLERFANKVPIFPFVNNERSMLSIENLCRFVKKLIDEEAQGLYLPQDEEYVNTSLLVKQLAEQNKKSIYLSKGLGMLVIVMGKKIKILNKIFGNLTYEKNDRGNNL